MKLSISPHLICIKESRLVLCVEYNDFPYFLVTYLFFSKEAIIN